jgi:hypothetical protein
MHRLSSVVLAASACWPRGGHPDQRNQTDVLTGQGEPGGGVPVDGQRGGRPAVTGHDRRHVPDRELDSMVAQRGEPLGQPVQTGAHLGVAVAVQRLDPPVGANPEHHPVGVHQFGQPRRQRQRGLGQHHAAGGPTRRRRLRTDRTVRGVHRHDALAEAE